MGINKRMYKEDTVCVCDGILLSHKKEVFESVLVRNEPRACYAERSKKERGKQVSYINADI